MQPKVLKTDTTHGRGWMYFKRALKWRCPECGVSPIFYPLKQTRRLAQWMTPLDGCPRCGYAYEREPGYFLLSTWGFSYGVIGILGLAAVFLIDGFFHPPEWKTLAIVLPPLSILSFLFIRHAKSLYLAMDHYFDPHVKDGRTS